MLSIFSCALWPSVCLLWRNVYLDLLSIYFLIGFMFLAYNYMSYLCILEINHLLVTLFANIFSHSVGCLFVVFIISFDFPGGSDGKASAYNAGDPGSIPGSGRSPGEASGNPLQYSCLENPMDRGAWWSKGSQRIGHD